MRGIPPALDTDTEDVTWALQTAEALWKRNERVDALVWLRRAAQAAGEAEHDDRALELAHDAAELAEWLATQPPRSGSMRAAAPATDLRTDADALREPRTTQTDEVEEVSVEVTVDSASSFREPLDAPTLSDELGTPPLPAVELAAGRLAARGPPPLRASRVPSAAEKHAGMLDPWAEGDTQVKGPPGEAHGSARGAAAARPFDTDEVVTSAPPIGKSPPPSAYKPRPTPPAAPSVLSRFVADRLDLSQVDALSDLPEDARDEFARAAVLRTLSQNEELSDFALALILAGNVDLAATIVDTPAQRLDAGAVVRARGTTEHVASLRLVAARDGVRVATWDELAVEDAFRTCPWVEDDLRAAGDRFQALVGVTMGPLGDRLDPVLRAQVASQLTLRALSEHEVFAVRGKPIPGMLVVGAGELELVGDEGVPHGGVLRAGDFLFPSEVLSAGPAPHTVRAGRGGALVLFADRHLAQELLVTCPPLLEIFAGM
jgi:hypothetical protein